MQGRGVPVLGARLLLGGGPFLLEALPDEARDLSVVLDHQDAHTRSVVAQAPRPVNAAADAMLCSRPPCSTRPTSSSTWATPRSSSSSCSATRACRRPRN